MFERLDDPIPFLPDGGFRAAVHRDGSRIRRRRRVATTTVTAVAVVTVLLAGVGVGAVNRQRQNLQRVNLAAVPQVNAEGNSIEPNVESFDRPFNLLVVGRDERSPGDPNDGPSQNTDTMMLVHVDQPAKQVRIVSLPRDLWVPIVRPGVGPVTDATERGRLNSALAVSRETLIGTINQLTGLTVDHYAEVDFAGFSHLVDAIGGVPLVFDQAARDDHSGLAVDAGCHVLDGKAALALVRSRYYESRDAKGRWHSDPSSDLGRISRQQVLAEALVRRAGQRASGLGGFAALARAATDTVVLDDHFGAGDLISLARWSEGLGNDAVRSMTPRVTATTIKGADVLLPDKAIGGDLRSFVDGGAQNPAPAPAPAPPGTTTATTVNAGELAAGPPEVHVDRDRRCG